MEENITMCLVKLQTGVVCPSTESSFRLYQERGQQKPGTFLVQLSACQLARTACQTFLKVRGISRRHPYGREVLSAQRDLEMANLVTFIVVFHNLIPAFTKSSDIFIYVSVVVGLAYLEEA